MSGNKERIPEDFPPCPKCLNNDFWTLREMVVTVVYLIRNQYTRADKLKYMVSFGSGGNVRDIERLDKVTYARCGGCGYEFLGDELMILVKTAKKLFNILRPRYR